MNVVNHIDLDHRIKSIHSTSRRQVVKGRGIVTATAAIPQLRVHNESSNTKKVWKVLFDSGSDGDIAFIKKSEKASIDTCIHDSILRDGKPVMISLKLTRLDTLN